MSQRGRVRLGLAGCGRIARAVHLPILAGLPGVEVVALADPDPDARRAASQIAPNAEALGHHQTLCARPDLDAIVVCVPSHLHAEAALAVLGAGKGLYLEKPIAMDLDQARKVAEAARRTGLPAMIGFNYRFHPLVETLARAARSGSLGTLTGWQSRFSVRAHPRPAWKRAVATGGGVLLDFASHHVDLVRLITRLEPREVFATVTHRGDVEEDTAAMLLTLDGGVTAQISCSWSGPEEDAIDVSGTGGIAGLDRQRSLALRLRGAAAPGTRAALLAASSPGISPWYAAGKLRAPAREPSYARALSHFAACLARGTAMRPDLDDGLRSLETIVAARRSAAERRPVPIGR